MGAFIAVSSRIIITLLMVSMGLRLSRQSFALLWRNPRLLVGSIAAAFVIVPAFTFLVFQVLPLNFAERAGLWVLAIAPGAPMIQTAASRRRFVNDELAGSFQVTAALLVIIFAPLWLLFASALTGSDYRMNPFTILGQVATVQLVPIVVGLIIHQKWPGRAERIGDIISKFGFLALTTLVLIIFVAFAKRIIGSVDGWEFLAAALVAACAIATGHFLTGPNPTTRATIATANAQRNIGLALAMAAWNLPNYRGPIALMLIIYAITAAIAQAVYGKLIAGGMRR